MTLPPGALTLPLLGLATGGATLFGGALVLRYRSFLDIFSAFSSGAIIAIALFDLLPESLEIGAATLKPLSVTTIAAVGFAVYLIADRIAVIFGEDSRARGRHLGPASLTLHSLMDGLAIGFSFQVSPTVGMIVAFAVLAHDLLDGANTVTLSLDGGSGSSTARYWLFADAAAPLAGIGLSCLFNVPAHWLSGVLGLFAGFFLYIGASDLLPRSHGRRPKLSTLAATLSGLAFIYVVVRLAAF